MKKILLYHPFGNQNVRGVLSALSENNMLESFHTTVAIFPHSILYNIYRCKLLNRFIRRSYSDKIKNQTICYPFKELLRITGLDKIFGINYSSGYINMKLSYTVAKYVKKNKNKIDGVYCYTHGALPIFQECKKNGILCIYELPTCYYKELIRISKDEQIRNPQWAETIHFFQNKQITDIIDQELNLADIVIVSSHYIKNSLICNGFSHLNIKVVPYGFPEIRLKQYHCIIKTDKLKLLYVGGLHQMKGLSYMFEACQNLKEYVELTVIGSNHSHCKILQTYLKECRYLNTLPHEQVLQIMAQSDVLLFPTLCDGFGMVVTEAMSQGTPVITTERSCAPDIITHGVNGWIVPAEDTQALQSIIMDIVQNPSIIKKVGENAIQSASRRSWKNYAKDITIILESL